jgi:hypothetical protein
MFAGFGIFLLVHRIPLVQNGNNMKSLRSDFISDPKLRLQDLIKHFKPSANERHWSIHCSKCDLYFPLNFQDFQFSIWIAVHFVRPPNLSSDPQIGHQQHSTPVTPKTNRRPAILNTGECPKRNDKRYQELTQNFNEKTIDCISRPQIADVKTHSQELGT